MEEIVHAFGIDGRLIVIQIFNFVLLMGALWYFLYTPVLNILEERRKKVEKGVKDAEEAEKALALAEAEKDSLLKEARLKSETILHDASKHAEARGEDILKEAEARASKMIADAKLRSEEEVERIRKASEADIAKAAMLAAERILADQK